MAAKSKIEWTDASYTPIRARNKATGKVGWHCEHASPGCVNCYSETQNKNGFAGGTRLPFKPGHRADVDLFLDEKMLTQPLRWRKPKVIFVCSMTDAFADFVPDAWLDRMFAVCALAPQHTFVWLTKRAKRMREYHADNGRLSRMAQIVYDLAGAPASMSVSWPLPNVVLGTSAEDQQRADERIPDLLATPAAKRIVSIEPMLGPIDLTGEDYEGPLANGEPSLEQMTGPHGAYFMRHGASRLNGVILGGESGPGARPALAAWRRSVRDQCAAAGVAYFDKQWGEWIDADEWLRMMETPCNRVMAGDRRLVSPLNFEDAEILAGIGSYRFEHQSDGSTMIRVGKSRAGRLLDGRTHDDLPWSLSK